MGYKILINKSGIDFSDLQLITRKGDDPANNGPTVNVGALKNGAQVKVDYPTEFLNGFIVDRKGSGSDFSIKQWVTVRGGAFDDTLNKNDTVTFTSYGGAATTGSNS